MNQQKEKIHDIFSKRLVFWLYAAIIFQQILGGLTYPIAKYGLLTIEPFTFAFYRFLISSIVLLFITWIMRPKPPIPRKDLLKIMGLGVMIVIFNQTAYLFGQRLTSTGHGSLLFATVPIWIFLAGMLHLKEKFVLRRGIGVVIGVIGVGIILATGPLDLDNNYLKGDLVIMMAVLVWTYYTIFGKPLVKKYGAIRVTAYALASGSLVYFPFGLYRAMIFDYSHVHWSAWLSVLYLALGLSVGSYVLWYWVLKYMDATRMAVYHNLQPVIASSLGALFLGETIGLFLVLGGIVALTGVIITELPGKKRKKAEY